MARMPKRQLVNSRLARSQTQTALFTSSSTSSSRLNTHVLLALSFLVLSANARPLDVMGHEFNIGNFLSGALPDAASLKGGITEQIAESVLKLFNFNGDPKQNNEETILSGIIPSSSPKADYTALTVSETSEPNENLDHDSTSTNQFSSSEKAHFIESLLAQNPAITMALGVADLMHKMKELFVDIAILEGEERGIHIPDDAKNEYLLDDTEEEEPNGLGLTLQPINTETQPIIGHSTVIPAPEQQDELQFSLELDMEDQVILPGQFTAPSTSDESTRPEEQSTLSHLNPLVNPYAAIALSAVLATLFVVGVVVGRHHYLVSQQAIPEDDRMERGGEDASDSGTSGDEKSSAVEVVVHRQEDGSEEEELNEKTEFDIHPLVQSGSATEDQEATNALALLIDVANAALASSANPNNVLKDASMLIKDSDSHGQLATTTTPKLVTKALETARIELRRTPRSQYLLPRSLPQTPRSITPALRVTAVDLGSPNGLSEKLYDGISPDLTTESAASSYTSASSMIRIASRPTSALRITNNSRLSSMDSPTRGYVTAQASPALSFATAQESTPIHRSITPLRPFSPQLRVPGALMPYDDDTSINSSVSVTSTLFTGTSVATEEDIGEVNMLGIMAGNGNGGMGMVPPAHLTQTALDLALMLPATEWIFQFIVVFIGWFGFLMRPVPAKERRRRRH